MVLQHDYHFIILKQHFPRISLGIEIRWGTRDLEPFILELINDTRGHTRQGFPVDVFNSLQSLLLLHHKLYPEKRLISRDPWDSTLGDFN